MTVTVATSRGPTTLAVELSDDPDPASALAALVAVAGSDQLVVERTGTSFRGAVVGRDVLPGDHLVPSDGRARPALVALAGPLRGERAVANRELAIGRGGRFGDQTVDDIEISRAHLRVSPTLGGLCATDVGSTNGTLHNDRPVEGPVGLRSGDRIELGATTVVVVGDPPREAHVRSLDGAVEIRCPDQLPPPMPTVGLEPPQEVVHPAQVAWRRALWPDPAHVAAAVAGWSQTVWSRQPGHSLSRFR